jgi:hypothetical protein
MFPRPSAVHLRLSPPQAETLYFELLGLLAHYRESNTSIEPNDERALLSSITQLELGIQRAQAVAETQLQHMRAAALRQEGA